MLLCTVLSSADQFDIARCVVNGLLMFHVLTVFLDVSWSSRPISRCAAAQREDPVFAFGFGGSPQDKIRASPISSAHNSFFDSELLMFEIGGVDSLS